MKTTTDVRKRAQQIVRLLKKAYPDAKCALNYENPLQLLIATILSAQCTDVRVNMVTPALFARYPNAEAFAQADPAELETAIQSTGFFRNKARNIRESCKQIVARYGGEVPGTLDELVALPGIGRKTANVVLGNAFDTPGITVDTHVSRVSFRLGLTKNTDAEKIERDLMELVSSKEWTMFSHRLIYHGRQICQARRPKCEVCILNAVCPKLGIIKPATTKRKG